MEAIALDVVYGFAGKIGYISRFLIEYRDDNGKIYQSWTKDPVGRNLRDGDTVQICYARNDPEVFVVNEPDALKSFIYGGVIFFIIMGILLYSFTYSLYIHIKMVKKHQRK